jgi:hypothetical protein
MCFGLCHTDVAAGERSAADFVRLSRDITRRDSNEAVGRLGSGEALAAVFMQRLCRALVGSKLPPVAGIKPFYPALGAVAAGEGCVRQPCLQAVTLEFAPRR